MPAHKSIFLRWIEEAEERRLRERVVLVTDASTTRAAAPAVIATAALILRRCMLRSKTAPQTDRDDHIGGSLSCLERNSGI